MTLQKVTNTGSITDRMNALAGKSLSEFEIRSLKRDIEALKKASIYEYHMLMGIYNALLKRVDESLTHHRASLPGGESVYYQNYAYSLRTFDRHEEALEMLIEALERSLGSSELINEIAYTMIRSGDYSRFDSLMERFQSANPSSDLSGLQEVQSVLGIRGALAEAGIPESEYKTARSQIGELLACMKLPSYRSIVHHLQQFDGNTYVSVELSIPELEARAIADINEAIADSMVDSGLVHWNRLVFKVVDWNSSSGMNFAHG